MEAFLTSLTDDDLERYGYYSTRYVIWQPEHRKFLEKFAQGSGPRLAAW